MGHTRISATGAFAPTHDDLFVTSYDDFEEVDLSEVASLQLVLDEGPAVAFDAVFDDACRWVRRHEASLTLAVPYAGAPLLGHYLDRGELRIEDVERTPTGLRVVVGPRGRPRLDVDVDDLILSALDGPIAMVDVDSPSPAPATEVTASGDAAPTRPPARRSARPRPRLDAHLAAVDRRLPSRGTAAAAAVIGVLIVLAVALLSSGSPRLVVVLGALALVVLVALVALSCMLVLLLARQLHEQTGRLERMVLRNRKVLQNRTVALGRRLGALEAGQARLPFAHDYLEAVAEASAGSSARLADLLQALESSGFDPEAHVDLHNTLHLQTQRQVLAQAQLVRLLELPGRLPPLGGWAASPDFGLMVVQELLRVRPAVAVELGSGATTLLMALAIRQHALPTRLVALEHRADFKERTESLLEDNGVLDLVDVRLAPLTRPSLPDHPTRWYDESALEGLADVGLVVVDGPPSYTGTRARYPAVPLLQPHLAERASILADDTIRDDDLEVVGGWARLLPDFEVELLDTLEKHAAVLRRH